MDRIGKPRGLIRYTSEREIEGKSTRIVRPRTILYSALLVLALSAFTVVLTQREAFDVNIGRAVGSPYTELQNGQIANRLRFRVRNQTGTAATVSVEAVSPGGVSLRPVQPLPIRIEPGEMIRFETWVMLPTDTFTNGVAEGVFRLDYDNGSGQLNSSTESFTLLGPTRTTNPESNP